MKTLFYSAIAAMAMLFPQMLLAGPGRCITDFDKGWKFSLSDPKGAGSPNFNDRGWRTLDLPHDWSIEGVNAETEPSGGEGGYFPTGTAWYRKTFDVPEYSVDRMYSIEFDGVYMNSEVWINGHYLGKWPYGYSSFSYDLTPWLKARRNVISVRVDNSAHPNTRWYTGSGIYRHVRLVSTNQTCFKKWGVFAYTESVSDGKALLRVESDIVNGGNLAGSGIIVRNVLADASGKSVAEVETPFNPGNSRDAFSACKMEVRSPRLWDIDEPYMYTLRSYIVADGVIVDCVETPIGIRTIRYDIDKGFFLNGRHVKLFGVNVHHDGGAVGAAVPERVWERRLEILKSGGCNAIRTAHNPPAPEFLDICDRLGLLVMDEAFDMWLAGKKDKDYHLYFSDWYEKDLEALVLRDRNHPSVVMWSIGNEVPDQSTAEGPMLARRMIDICRRHDPTRPVTSGNDRIKDEARMATEEYLAEFADEIVGYNYPDRFRSRRETMYTEDKIMHPDRRVVATEAGGLSGTRAYGQQNRFRFNMRDDGKGAAERDMASRVPASASYIDTEQRWKYTLRNDFVIGDFMWTGIDYYGETRWPSRGAGSGYLDNCGFKKDGYYFFKSIWTDEPVLHLANGWNYSEDKKGQIVQVSVFTNFDYVELFVNGRSYGVKSREFPRKGQTITWNVSPADKVRTSTADLHLSWDVEYQPGEVRLVGVKKGVEHSSVFRTPGKPSSLRVSVDRERISSGPGDVAHVTVEVLDKDGNLVTGPDGNVPVALSVSGPARLIGIESGNMSDLSSTKSSERKAYGGMILGIFRAEGPGSFTVTASSEGLLSGYVLVGVD